jgi:hypothetical protein
MMAIGESRIIYTEKQIRVIRVNLWRFQAAEILRDLKFIRNHGKESST